MMISEIILVFFSHICKPAFGNWIGSKCLSQKNIPFVLFILNHPHNTMRMPAYFSFFILNSKFHQPFCNRSRSITLQIHIINHTDNLRFFLIDSYALVLGMIIISITAIETDQFAALHFHLQSHLDIL